MSTRSRPFVLELLIAFGGLALAELWQLAWVGGPVSSDFFGLWSWSDYVAVHGVAGLYDPAVQQAFQRALDPFYTDLYYPFLYPPTYLLIIWPLAHFPMVVARVLWSGATMAAFLFALFGGRWRPVPVLAAALAPASVLCLICGQNGLLTAALMLGGMRLARDRPVLGGVLLGLLSYKPHLAMLVPVALVAAGLWRTLAGAAASAAISALASAAIFGLGPWRAFLARGGSSWSTVDGFIGQHGSLVPTVNAALQQIGLGPGAALAGQVVAALAAAAAVYVSWRGERGAVQLMVLAVGALLATPYAFLYDLPMVAGSALLLLEERVALERTLGCTLTPIDRAFLLGALLLPQVMFVLDGPALPLAAPVLALVLCWLLWSGGGSGRVRGQVSGQVRAMAGG